MKKDKLSIIIYGIILLLIIVTTLKFACAIEYVQTAAPMTETSPPTNNQSDGNIKPVIENLEGKLRDKVPFLSTLSNIELLICMFIVLIIIMWVFTIIINGGNNEKG